MQFYPTEIIKKYYKVGNSFNNQIMLIGKIILSFNFPA